MKFPSIAGYATIEGTKRYAEHFSEELPKEHFRETKGLFLSSVGLGSYLGEPDDATDKAYEKTFAETFKCGVNVFDTAINYRAQRSERSFGRALTRAIHEGIIRREELILSTKAGFLPFDGEYPDDARTFFRQAYLETGLLKEGDLSQGCHAMSVPYLEDQLVKSLKNLNVETVDIFYLHNPEMQLLDHSRTEFYKRLKEAFAFLESKVQANQIRWYGVATWGGFRVAPEAKDYLSLEELVVAAREAGGKENHFKAVQLPVNLAMPEAWVAANQNLGANQLPFLQVAKHYGLTVFGSAALLQSRLSSRLPDFLVQKFPHFKAHAQCALQFARSVPGLTTSLVGMRSDEHVRENREVFKARPLTEEEILLLFQQG